MFSEGFSALDEDNEPMIENRGRDTDTFSFIMTLASMMDELMKGSAISAEVKPLFQQLRNAYLDLILEKLPGGTPCPRNRGPFRYFPEGFMQKSRSEWPQDMEIILQKLRSALVFMR
jgi:hypothetical protein